MNGINKILRDIHQNALDHGWWEQEREFPEIAALIHFEASEALEEYRNGHAAIETYYRKDNKSERILSELADVIIRIFDYCGYAGIDIEKAVKEKHEFNKSRSYRHGGKVC